MATLETSPTRFFDGDAGWPSELKVSLERVLTEEGTEEWAMVRRVGYRVRRHRGVDNVELIVPAQAIQDPQPPSTEKRFTSDLTSVPQLFTWLVPKSGTHLPAALLHDGLVTDGRVEHDGPPVNRVEADRIFREAMADLGTPLVRRWLVWTAVTLATVKERLAHAALLLTLLVIGVVGYLATLDLFDQIDVLCWMGDRPWNRELIYGLAVALAAPVLLSAPWLAVRLYRAGLIAGWALAVLFHVTVAVVAVSIGYQLTEWTAQLVTRQRPRVKPWLALAGLLGLGLLTWLTVWLCRRNP